VSGVKQQEDVVIDQRHKFVDLCGSLDTSPHMMVQAHLHALPGGQAPQRVVTFGDALPLFLAKAGFCLADNRFFQPLNTAALLGAANYFAPIACRKFM
jgi:hypothetical protein